jgi:hypothetical protein
MNQDDDSDESDVEGEESSKETKSLRTCTATLKQILRPELLSDEVDHIVSIAEDRQKTITTVMGEIAVLARKTVHLVS